MGNEHTTTQTSTIVNDDLPSDLYRACQENDINLARSLLETSRFSDINRLEPNGSTALHVATSLGHVDIVQLLLHDYGVMRHAKDRNGQTAYEVAPSDDIRRLFHRPNGSNRFYSNGNSHTQFSINREPPSGRVQGYMSVPDVRRKQNEEIRSQVKDPFQLFQATFKRLFRYPEEPTHALWAASLLSLIDQEVGTSHKQYPKACELIHSYAQTLSVQPLLRLYTLETPFYRYLNSEKGSSDLLAQPLLDGLRTLYTRIFRGHCFRGLSMTNEDLQAYKWAYEHQDSYLGTNIFCSTSTDENVATFYTEASNSDNKIGVLMVFDFPQTCSTAIRLYADSSDLSSLSDFENEREILLLPGTVFSVENITTDGYFTKIYLKHFNIEQDADMYRYALFDQHFLDV